MSPPTYRIEREPMAPGQRVPLFRVVVRLAGGRWGRVQTGLTRDEADPLLASLLLNEVAKYRTNRVFAHTGLPCRGGRS